MFKLSDRVKETTLTQGTGSLVLAGSFGAFQTFTNGIGDGNSTYYTIENNNNFEIGIGTLNSNILSRDTILSSSNNNNKINLNGVSIVFCTYPASKSVFLEDGFIKSLSPQYSGIIFPDLTTLTSASGISSFLPSGLVYTDDSRLSDDRNPLPHNHTISEVDNLQDELDSKQPSGNYSIVGHGHSIGDITDLQTALDSKQPSGSYANLSHSHLIADVSGLQTALDSKQPSGSYANLSHSHLIADVSGLQTALDSKQPSGSYANLSHSHLIADVSGLQTALDSKQPSGSYANSVHTHSVSDITNFQTGVSGLLPVTNILGGTNVNISSSGSVFTVNISGQLGVSAEEVDDRVSQLLIPGTGMSLNYDDNSNTLTINNQPEILSYTNTSYFPSSGNADLVYISLDDSRQYKWTGSEYVEMGAGASSTYIQNHTHASSSITDFNSSVSGLLPVKNIIGSGNITSISTTGVFTISSSGLIKSDITGITGASTVINVVQISQANYDALGSYDPNTLYVIN